MSKNMIIGIAVAGLLVVGGAAAYVVTQNNDSTTNDAGNNAEVSQQIDQNGQPEFRPVTTDGLSFVATLSGTSEGQQIDGTIKQDRSGNTKFSATTQEGSAEFYMIGDKSYTCTNGQCFSFSASDQNPNPLDELDVEYTYDDDQIASIEESATYQGQQPCPAGSCNVWRVTEEGYETDIYISTSDNRISQFISKGEDTEFKMVYEYKDVTINPPQNVQELPGF